VDSKITLKKSDVVVGNVIDNSYKIIDFAGKELTFIKEEAELSYNRDSNPKIYGRRRVLVQTIPQDNFEKSVLKHKYIEYYMGTQYNRIRGENPKQVVPIDVDDITPLIERKPILIDKFDWGSPMYSKDRGDERYILRLKQGFSIEDSVDKN